MSLWYKKVKQYFKDTIPYYPKIDENTEKKDEYTYCIQMLS